MTGEDESPERGTTARSVGRRAAAAGSARLPWSAVQRLVDDSPAVRQRLGETPGVDRRFLVPLLDDPDVDVRRQTACCTDDPEVLRAAVGHADPDVRGFAALNPRIAPDQLRALARDGRAAVRAMVAQVPPLPEDVVELLADDRSVAVRHLVLHRRLLPRRIAEALVHDADARIADDARARLDGTLRPFEHDASAWAPHAAEDPIS